MFCISQRFNIKFKKSLFYCNPFYGSPHDRPGSRAVVRTGVGCNEALPVHLRVVLLLAGRQAQIFLQVKPSRQTFVILPRRSKSASSRFIDKGARLRQRDKSHILNPPVLWNYCFINQDNRRTNFKI